MYVSIYLSYLVIFILNMSSRRKKKTKLSENINVNHINYLILSHLYSLFHSITYQRNNQNLTLLYLYSIVSNPLFYSILSYPILYLIQPNILIEILTNLHVIFSHLSYWYCRCHRGCRS